jgi:hypothetical protein
MTNDHDRKDHPSKNLVFMMIFWLGVLTGVVAALLFLQVVNTSDLKSDVLSTPLHYTVMPGPTPWMPGQHPGFQ